MFKHLTIAKSNLLLLSLLSFSAFTITWVFFFLFPKIHALYGFSKGQSVLIIVLSYLGIILSTYFWAKRSDETGKRLPYLYSALLIIGVATIAGAFISDYRLAAIISFISGIGTGSFAGVYFALLTELTQRKERATVAGIVDAVSLIPAAAIYAFLSSANPVVVVTILGFIPFIGILLCKRLEKGVRKEVNNQLPVSKKFITAPKLAFVLILLSFAGWGIHGPFTDVPFKATAEHFGIYSQAWLIRILLYMVFFVVGGVLADRYGRIRVWSMGFFLRALGVYLFAQGTMPFLSLGILAAGLGHINDGLGMMLFGEYASKNWQARVFAFSYIFYLVAQIVGITLSAKFTAHQSVIAGIGFGILAGLFPLLTRRHFFVDHKE